MAGEHPYGPPQAHHPQDARPVPQPSPGAAVSGGSRLVGWLLLAPALAALALSHITPAVQTIVRSLHGGGWTSPASFTLDNYPAILNDDLLTSLGHLFLLGLAILAVGLGFGVPLALTANVSGRGTRLVTRALLSLAALYLATLAIATGLTYFTYGPNKSEAYLLLGEIDFPVATLAWLAFPLIVALGVTALLPALRGPRPSRAVPVAIWVLSLGTVAVTLQSSSVFSVSRGILGDVQAPSSYIVTMLITNELGPATAASAVLILVLALLGLGAVVPLLTRRARLTFDRDGRGQAGPGRVAPSSGDPMSRRRVGTALTVVFLLFTLAVLGYVVIPWFALATDVKPFPSAVDGLTTAELLANTWLPPLASAFGGVVLAVLGGFAIGVLRPLGRHSEWLLLLFAPWLFVGTMPLSTAQAEWGYANGLQDSPLMAVPPGWFCVPALVACALLFSGEYHRRSRRNERSSGWRTRIALVGMPMGVLALLLDWLLGAQQAWWGYLFASSGRWTTPEVVLTTYDRAQSAGPAGLDLLFPIPLIVCFVVAIAALHVGYLDRLTLSAGPDVPEGPAGSYQAPPGTPEAAPPLNWQPGPPGHWR